MLPPMRIGEWNELGRSRQLLQRQLGELGAAEFAAHVTVNENNGRLRIFVATDVGRSWGDGGTTVEGTAAAIAAWLTRSDSSGLGGEVPPPPATPGTCLTWSRPDAADTEVVDCAQPHLFEQAGSVTLAADMALPDDRQWRQLVNERCTPVVVDYLGGKFDPDGRFRVGALKPSPAKWADGDRGVRCFLWISDQDLRRSMKDAGPGVLRVR